MLSDLQLIQNLKPAMTTDKLLQIQKAVEEIHVSDALLDYVQLLISETRNKQLFVYGLSPRAALSLLKAARAWALMRGHDFVEPGDIKAVFSSISNHRLIPTEQHSKNAASLVENILQQVAIP